MRTRISRPAAVLIAAAAAAGIGLGAPSAQATQPTHAHSAVQGTTSEHRTTDALDDWVLRGKYWTFDGCNSAGRQGVERQAWDQYQCADGTLQWVLWTNR